MDLDATALGETRPAKRSACLSATLLKWRGKSSVNTNVQPASIFRTACGMKMFASAAIRSPILPLMKGSSLPDRITFSSVSGFKMRIESSLLS